MTLNVEQKKVVDSIDGVYIVDAGAGTGKTFTITKRYLNILDKKSVLPEDILLVTFTRNAAANMKEKVISEVSDINLKDKLLNAPICSFDSFCSKLVSSNGLNAPKYLGIDYKLSGYKLVTESVIISRIFRRFFNSFLKNNEKDFEKVLALVDDSDLILNLLESLLCKGIYPTKSGWFLDAGNKVLGDRNKVLSRISKLNKPRDGQRGPLKSELLGFYEKCLKEKNYDRNSLFESYDAGKCLNLELVESAFDDDNVKLLEEFVHRVYFEYIGFMAKNNYMTFSLNSMYAFLILFNDKRVRDEVSFDYVMIDEFQDTNELQFMLILLLMKKDNLCVVGDWKQGIYGFRNASIKNITKFESKFNYFCSLINYDGTGRVAFDYENVEFKFLEFKENYRSSQMVLDFSVNSFKIRGSQNEVVEKVGDVVPLNSFNTDFDNYSNVEFMCADSGEREIDMILHKINSIVGKKMLPLGEGGTDRFVEFSDIAILSRTRSFGLNILNRCEEVGCPAVYDGGIYLFSTEPAILLLAWAKLLLDKDCRSSWITILDKENLPYLEIERILKPLDDKTFDYPNDILEFREKLLLDKRNIGYIVDEIFRKYGFNNAISNRIVQILDDLFSSTLVSLSDLVVFIEEAIENNADFTVEIGSGVNAVKIQTIHGSKGLEYPIVFVVNCNQSSFPMTSKSSGSLFYDESCGFRCKYEISDKYKDKFAFNSWKSDLISFKLFSDYDEERRLMYVATTRAMFDVYLTCNRPSQFFKDMVLDADILSFDENSKFDLNFNFENDEFDFSEDVVVSKNSKEFKQKVSAHDLMNEFEVGLVDGRGKTYGSKIHKLAYRCLSGFEVDSTEINKIPMESDLDTDEPMVQGVIFQKDLKKDWLAIKKFIDGLKFEKSWAEMDCSLKLSDNIFVSGIIDAVFDLGDKLLIVDWKTDVSKIGLNEYRKQLSVYYHVLAECFVDREIEVGIFWSYFDEFEKIDVLSREELLEFVE